MSHVASQAGHAKMFNMYLDLFTGTDEERERIEAAVLRRLAQEQ